MPRSREISIDSSVVATQLINLLTNPDMEAGSGTSIVRSNRDTNPRNLGTPTSGRAPGRNAYSSGSPTGTYAMSGEIQQFTITAMAAGVGTERFGTTSSIALGSLYPANTPVTVSMDTSVVVLPAGIRARVYVDLQDTTNANVKRAHWDAFFDATTGRISGTLIPNGTADRILMYVWLENNNAGAAFSGTATVGFTKAMVEANYAAPYFDGGTQPVLRTNRINTPQATAGWPSASPGTGGTAPASFVPDARFAGSNARRSDWTVSASASGWINFPQASFTQVGETWFFSMRYVIAGNSIEPVVSIGGGSRPVYTSVRGTVDHGDGTKTAWLLATITGLGTGNGNGQPILSDWGTMSVGAYLLAGNAYMEQRTNFTTYFDGFTTKAGFSYAFTGTANASASTETDLDLSVRWAGAANGSVSELFGITVVGPASVDGIAYVRSSRWSASGLYSARMIATSATNSVTFTSYTLPAATITGGTLVITSYLEAPITGGSWSMLGKLYTNPSSSTYVSAQRPNIAGTFEHRLSFGAGQGNFILSHGGILGSPDIWYDLALLIADPAYSGPAWTGSTPSKDGVVYRWSAGVDTSTSIKETYSLTGGLQLNDPKGRWWIARATPPRTPAARRHTSLQLPGRDGDYPMTRESRNSGTYGLVMHIQGINALGGFDAAAADRSLSRLLSAMSGEFLMTETLNSADGNPLIRQAFGQLLNGVSPVQKPTLKVLEVTMPINLTDGRWRTPNVSQVTPTLTITASPVYFYELPGVDAETDDIIIRLSSKNNTGKVSVFNGEYNARANGAFSPTNGISYAAVIPAGNYVFIDVKNFVAKQGTSATDWAMAGGTDVTSNLDYPATGKLDLSPTYISALDTSLYIAMVQAEAAATSAAITIQVRGAYQ